MNTIDRTSGLEGWILRPLSARLLPPTEPERLGWVDRGRLLDLRGRTRVEQLRLAREAGLTAFASPGGGCLLTDPLFSVRVRDLFDHVPAAETVMVDLELLRIGRHFYLDARARVVLGRSEEENRRLETYAGPDRWLVDPDGFSGPTALVCGPWSEDLAAEAASLILGHTRAADPERSLRWRHGDRIGSLSVAALRLAAGSGSGTPGPGN
jgi:tRNA-uridine 2-sulfurtransferase